MSNHWKMDGTSLTKGRWFEIGITQQQIFEERLKFKTHREYIKFRFKVDHGVDVLDFSLLENRASDDYSVFVVRGYVGKGVSQRRG